MMALEPDPAKIDNPHQSGDAPRGSGWFGQCELRPWFVLLIAVAPLIVFLLSDYLLRRMGARFDHMPPFGLFDPLRAEALRLDVASTFFLFAAGAVGAFLYFLYTLRMLRFDYAYLVGSLFIVSTLAAGTQLVPATNSQADRFVDSAFVCTALGYKEPDPKKLSWKELPADATKVRKFEPKDARVGGKTCDAAVLADLRWLIRWNKLSILIGLAALVLGSICCLARPAAGSAGDAEQQKAHYDTQSERLNTYLYLSAILLVSGLMFVAALQNWPAHAVPAGSSYDVQAKSLTAYYGYSYTAILASFYVPVAMILSAETAAVKSGGTVAEAVPEAFKGPVQVLKIAAAIFSPSLVPIAAGVLGLG